MYLVKKIGFLLLVTFALSACSKSDHSIAEDQKSTKADQVEKTYKIGLMQISKHPALDAATKGFKQALNDKNLKVEFIFQNAQGDMNNNSIIANNLVGREVDLIFANSTPCAQAALSVTKDIPIVFTSVADPIGAKLIHSMQHSENNVTGTTDNHPDAIPKILKFIAEEFPGKRIGMIYNSGEQNSLVAIQTIKEYIKDTAFTLIPVAITNSSEVKQAAESLAGRVDFIFINTDNTVASAIKSVVHVCENEKIPLFVAWIEPVKYEGAFAAYGFDYEDLGYQAGEMASLILIDKKKPSDLAIEYPRKLKLYINKRAANKMDVKIKTQWDKIAEYIE